MGILVKHIACTAPNCSSSDGLAVYEERDGTYNGFCFVCETNFPSLTLDGEVLNNKTGVKSVLTDTTAIDYIERNTSIMALPHRKISEEVAEIYGVRASLDEATGEIDKWYYPKYVKDKFAGYKSKDLNKNFVTAPRGIKNADLFGKHAMGSPRRMIVITEGEDDAMAATEMFRKMGKDYAVVSLPDGANRRGMQTNIDWIEAHNHIVICFDQDEAGKKVAQQAIDLFTPGKVKVMSFSEKDANEMWMRNKQKEFLSSLYQAATARPDGIVSGGDTWERIKNRPKVKSIPYPDGWDMLNKMTYGMRVGELDTWTSGSGMGKTQVMRILQKHLLDVTDDGIGIIALEEPLEDTVEALMALQMRKRLSLPDVREKVSDDELYEAWQATAGTNRIHLYDHFGSVDDKSLIKKITYMAKALDCKYIFLDHLSIVVSEFASEGGERERIDSIMTQLKNLTQSLGIWLGLIVHLRKTQGSGKSFEEGAVPTLDDLRGSGGIKQLSNNVYALSRDQQCEDDELRNTSHLHSLKCRFTGRTGPADFLFFDDNTGLMVPCANPSERIDDEKGGGF